MNPFYEFSRDQNPEFFLERSVVGVITPHFHQQIEIYIILEGSVRATVNDMSKVLSAGEIAFSDSFDIHSYQNVDRGIARVLILPVHYLSNFLKYKCRRTLQSNFVSDQIAVREVSAAVNRLIKTKNPLQRQGVIDDILGRLIDSAGLTSDAPRSDIFVARNVLMFLSENFLENLSLQDVADKFGYSKNYFSALFNRFFKCSFCDYVNALRINHYHTNKNYETKTVLEAALMSGFSSSATFYRALKKYNESNMRIN